MRRSRKWILIGVAIAAVLGLVAAALLASGVTVASVSDRLSAINAKLVAFLGRLDPTLLIVALAILPVFGFFPTVVYLMAGAKFGLIGGGIVVTFVTSAHLLLTHLIARSFLRDRIERSLAKHRHHIPVIPHGAEIGVAAMLVLVPLLPYFVRNFLLAISGIPLRIYFAVCVPLYVAHSYLTIYIGDFGMKPSRHQAVIIAVIWILRLIICAALLQYLRKRYYHKPHTA